MGTAKSKMTETSIVCFFPTPKNYNLYITFIYLDKYKYKIYLFYILYYFLFLYYSVYNMLYIIYVRYNNAYNKIIGLGRWAFDNFNIINNSVYLVNTPGRVIIFDPEPCEDVIYK